MNQQANQNTNQPRHTLGVVTVSELAWLGCAFVLAAFASLMALGGNSTPAPPASLDRMPATLTWPPSPAAATATTAAFRLASPLPPPTAAPATNPQPGAATPTGGQEATMTRTATSEAALTSGSLTWPPAALPAASTPTSMPANPQALVQGAAIPLAGSDPGSWQGGADGITAYQLPEGAAEGEALGQIAAVGASLSVQIASVYGEDCGAAVGNPQNFTLVRLLPAGQGELDVLLDKWQGANYTTPPPQATLRVKSDAQAMWHTLRLTYSSGQLTYTVDGRSETVAVSPPPDGSAYLYAGGSGCQYRLAP